MDEFQKVISELTELFRQFTIVGQMKLDAAAGDHIATVEECVKQEQALTMKLRGLERQREKKQEELGYKDMRFREILEAVSEEEQKELLPLFEGLSREIQMFQEINEDAGRIISSKLHVINRTIHAKEGNVYAEDGKPKDSPRYMTSRKA